MRIENIEIQNFKSIGSQTFFFNDVNVLIGANASGKSNFIQVFEFLKSIKKNGIQEAVVNLGGIKKIINFNSDTQRVKIRIEINPKVRSIIRSEIELSNKKLIKNTNKIIYEIVLRATKQNNFDFKETLTFYQYFSINTFQEETLGTEIEQHGKIFQYGIIKEFNGAFRLIDPEPSAETFLYIDFETKEEANYSFEFAAPLSLKMIE
ncbi:MAG: AAA family ATPase, partial [Saprospiraceae bacterium]